MDTEKYAEEDTQISRHRQADPTTNTWTKKNSSVVDQWTKHLAIAPLLAVKHPVSLAAELLDNSHIISHSVYSILYIISHSVTSCGPF